MFKAHAEERFWEWVSGWAKAMRKPSDFGFDDNDFILPELTYKTHILKSKKTTGFTKRLCKGLKEQRAERKKTIVKRCEKVAELAEGYNGESVLAWCHYNYEGDMLEKLGFTQVSGSDCDEKKDEIFMAFVNGEIKKLVTKPKIAAFGLNWQHCHRIIDFPTNSFEQWYQGIRRCWRFGQEHDVSVDTVTTESEAGVLLNLRRKAKATDKMFSELVKTMSGLKIDDGYKNDKKVSIPQWL